MVSAPSNRHVSRRQAASLGYRDDYMIVPLGKQEGGERSVAEGSVSRERLASHYRSTFSEPNDGQLRFGQPM